ncbi:MAG: response regulator transcription factor [Acidobacteriota bacterium]
MTVQSRWRSGGEGRRAPIRVFLADDHPVVREGLRFALDLPDVEVVGEASSGRETLAAVRRLRPEVLILDIRMPDMDGIQVLKAVKAASPHTAVILFTSYEQEDYVKAAVHWGAAAYLLKGAPGGEVVGLVRRVAEGERVLAPSLLARAAEGEQPAARQPSGLSPKEREILQRLAGKLTLQEIADELGLSLNTVKTHVRHLFLKLGVSDRTQAALWAVRNGVVTLGG